MKSINQRFYEWNKFYSFSLPTSVMGHNDQRKIKYDTKQVAEDECNKKDVAGSAKHFSEDQFEQKNWVEEQTEEEQEKQVQWNVAQL